MPIAPFYSQLISPSPYPFNKASVPSELKVMVIGPHPDDFDSIGVTLKHLHENGNPIDVGVIPTASGIEPSYLLQASLHERIEHRKEEQRKSIDFFGLPPSALTFLDLERDADDQVLNHVNNQLKFNEYLFSKQSDWFFLPHGNDTNEGHRQTYALFRQFARHANYPILAFFIRDPKTIGMRLDVYMPFGEKKAQWKAELLRIHDSQHQRNLNTRGHGFDERILKVNSSLSQELNLEWKYAEAFEVEYLNTGKSTTQP